MSTQYSSTIRYEDLLNCKSIEIRLNSPGSPYGNLLPNCLLVKENSKMKENGQECRPYNYIWVFRGDGNPEFHAEGFAIFERFGMNLVSDIFNQIIHDFPGSKIIEETGIEWPECGE